MPNDGGRFVLTDEETKRVTYVKQHYDHTVTLENVAWWRRESEYRSEDYMLKHFPYTEVEAFISSGRGFFPARVTLQIADEIASHGSPYKGYKYVFNEDFLASQILPTTNADEVDLKVWEHPEPGGHYAVGIDPSGGGGGVSDDHAIQVLRCYTDKLVQVAEFRTNVPYTYQLAWVLAHLCGAYRNHTAILEVSGIGAAVIPEVSNLRLLAQRGFMVAFPKQDQILNMVGNVRWFLYKRTDSLGGVGNVTNWVTNANNKREIFERLRSAMGKPKFLEIRSEELIRQCQAIVEDEGHIEAGPDTGEGDDLVMAFVLAVKCYSTLVPGLIANKITWDTTKGVQPPKTMSDVLSFMVAEKRAQMERNADHKRRMRFR